MSRSPYLHCTNLARSSLIIYTYVLMLVRILFTAVLLNSVFGSRSFLCLFGGSFFFDMGFFFEIFTGYVCHKLNRSGIRLVERCAYGGINKSI